MTLRYLLCALKEKAFVYENPFFVCVVNRYHVTSKYSLFILLTCKKYLRYQVLFYYF